jgi:hypothetical protein
LRHAWEASAQATLRRTLLLAMAMVRQDEAVEFLLARLVEDGEKSALDALAALALYSRDDSVRSRIREIVGKRESSILKSALEKDFGTG